MKKKALEYLERDFLQNVGMIDMLRRDAAEVIRMCDKGVLIKANNGPYLISAETVEAVDYLLQDEVPRVIVTQQMFYVEYLKKTRGYDYGEECTQSVYTGGRLELENKRLDIRQLDISYKQVVRDHYEMASDREIERLLTSNSLWGGFYNDELVGFIGIHSEGSLGALEIFPEYRKMGFGKELECFIVNWAIDNGRIPYGHIVMGNENSLRLQRSLGMEFAKEHICWVIKEKQPTESEK